MVFLKQPAAIRQSELPSGDSTAERSSSGHSGVHSGSPLAERVALAKLPHVPGAQLPQIPRQGSTISLAPLGACRGSGEPHTPSSLHRQRYTGGLVMTAPPPHPERADLSGRLATVSGAPTPAVIPQSLHCGVEPLAPLKPRVTRCVAFAVRQEPVCPKDTSPGPVSHSPAPSHPGERRRGVSKPAMRLMSP